MSRRPLSGAERLSARRGRAASFSARARASMSCRARSTSCLAFSASNLASLGPCALLGFLLCALGSCSPFRPRAAPAPLPPAAAPDAPPLRRRSDRARAGGPYRGAAAAAAAPFASASKLDLFEFTLQHDCREPVQSGPVSISRAGLPKSARARGDRDGGRAGPALGDRLRGERSARVEHQRLQVEGDGALARPPACRRRGAARAETRRRRARGRGQRTRPGRARDSSSSPRPSRSRRGRERIACLARTRQGRGRVRRDRHPGS